MTRKQLTDPFASDEEDDSHPAASTSTSSSRRTSPGDRIDSLESKIVQRDAEVPSLLVLSSPEEPSLPVEAPPSAQSPTPSQTSETKKSASRSRDSSRDSATSKNDLKDRARKLLEETKRQAAAARASGAGSPSPTGAQPSLNKPGSLSKVSNSFRFRNEQFQIDRHIFIL